MNILKPKQTPDVAGKLVCAAAGIESDDCVEAVKTEESNEDKETANPDEQKILKIKRSNYRIRTPT